MAKDLVCSCLYIHDARDAFQRAKMLLKENFGQPYQITSAFISKLTEGPSLATNNSSELSAFAIDLETCVITLKGIGCVNKINTQHILRQIIDRLPVPIQHKWRAVADNIMHEVKKNISIEDIVHFLRKQARELSNPVFDVSVKKRVNNQNLFFASAVKSNTDSIKSCLMCWASHYLNHCKRFRKFYQHRYKFVIQKKLCFACLQPGHRTDRCSRTDCCRKENCNKKHTTLLHPPPPPPTSDKKPASSKSAECAFVGFSENKTNDVMLPIVLVKVRASSGGIFVKTYALLDPGSTTTFCSIDLLNELNVTGRYFQLTTTTISNRNVATNAQLIQNLEVCDFNENDHVVLSQCFSLKSLPISKIKILTKLDASNWDYVNHISMPKL